VGESSLPSVIVSIIDDRVNTLKTTDEGVSGLKNCLGRNEQRTRIPECGPECGPEYGFGITGVGSGGDSVFDGKSSSSTYPRSSSERVRMCSDGGLTIDSTSSLSSDEDGDSDSEDLPSSDDDSGFAFASVRGALDQVASSSGVAATSGVGVGVVRGHDVAVPVRFTVPLTSSLEIVWDAILCRKALIVPRLPTDGASGSKESLIQLLEFAEDQLGCESVFICSSKAAVAPGNNPNNNNTTSTLVRMFSFLGFSIVDMKDDGVVGQLPSVFRSMPLLAEGTVMQYDIEDSDF